MWPKKVLLFGPTVVVALILLVVALVAASCAPRRGPSASTPSRPPTEPQQQEELTGPGFDASYWPRTDFSKHSVPLGEIVSGGPPPDGIPAIDRPQFLAPAEADWLQDREPVIALELGGEARAYPLQVLVWHEIVNDEVAGVPVLVTFCPLCNTAIAFDRRLEGRTLDFGTTGNLRFSDLVMYDRQTHSWWQQITGEAIVGELTGKKLEFLPASIISWRDFRQAFPQGQVLSRDTGFVRDYGRNPYVGYDDIGQPPFLYRGGQDPRLPPMERVVTVSLGGEDKAYPFSLLVKEGAINDRVGGVPIVVFFRPGLASALDRPVISESRDIGAGVVFSPIVEGRKLTFYERGGSLRDRETGSQWDVLGRATAGRLVGKALTPVLHGNHFWFAWAAFKPQTVVYQP